MKKLTIERKDKKTLVIKIKSVHLDIPVVFEIGRKTDIRKDQIGLLLEEIDTFDDEHIGPNDRKDKFIASEYAYQLHHNFRKILRGYHREYRHTVRRLYEAKNGMKIHMGWDYIGRENEYKFVREVERETTCRWVR